MRLVRFGHSDEEIVVFDVDDVVFARIKDYGKEYDFAEIAINFGDDSSYHIFKTDAPRLYNELKQWVLTRDWEEGEKVKLQIIEFKVEEGDNEITYRTGYRYTHLYDPVTEKYYELSPGEIELDPGIIREIDEDG